MTTNTGDVIALDAVTGAERWRYVPTVDLLGASVSGEVQPVNRGVVVAEGRVFLLTYDSQLIALDRRDGRELWKTRVADLADGLVQTSPPTYWDGRLIVGGSGSDSGATRGAVAAFDADTGERLWRFWTVPEGRGGGRVWMPTTVDQGTGLVYAGTGNPSPALAPGREGCAAGDWVSGLIALDARDGRLVWGAHEVCGDVWDYDGGQPPLLFDARVDGRDVRAVGHANKSGTYWIRDAATGDPLVPERALAQETQPRPRPDADGVEICPGALGGVSYGPAALDPGARTIFQPVVRLCMTYRTGEERPEVPAIVLGGGSAYPRPGTTATGAVVALDADTGEERWRRALPGATVGGALATAGRLVFTGADDGRLYALDADTGETRWREDIGLPFGTAPITYRIDGVQYLAVVAGGSATATLTGVRPGARLIVLKLDGGSLP